MSILLLVATMTGTAEMLAEDIRDLLPEHQVDLVLAEKAQPEQVVAAGQLIVVSSTYGDGEVPSTAESLFDALGKTLDAMPASTAPLRFGVIGLGDRSLYASTFANGARLWDAMLAAKGAQRVIEPLLLDCSACPDLTEASRDWLERWQDALVMESA